MKLVTTTFFSILAPTLFALSACGGGSGETNGEMGGQGGAASGGSASSGGTASGNDEFVGSVTFDGTTLDCDVEVDTFTSGEYSITCDNDEDPSNYRYIEVTFKDEASARTAQNLVVVEPFDFTGGHEDPKTVSVGWTDSDGTLYSTDDSTGTAIVEAEGGHFVLKLDAVSVASNTDDKTGALSATIPF